jgi:hypothetical protein
VRLRGALVVRDPESSAEYGEQLSLLEAVLLRKIRAPFEVAAVEGLDHQSPSGSQGFDHRRPHTAVEKPEGHQNVVALSGKRKAGDVARDRADAPPPFLRGGRELSESFEAPIEGVDGKTLLGEVERVRAETASDVEGAPRWEMAPTLDERGRLAEIQRPDASGPSTFDL